MIKCISLSTISLIKKSYVQRTNVRSIINFDQKRLMLPKSRSFSQRNYSSIVKDYFFINQKKAVNTDL
jgi:hypothetical protein